ncbi:MAG TPA: DNA-directed RNA polymerase subunit alpha [Candidatus Saccharimonadales bacterium]|nr:DNA-directed RNA polymerase subunit alpha [Candidatus Saccharimonadales bacterium]
MSKSTYKPLTMPTLGWEKKSMTQTFGKLTAQPLESGFGITLGNALRRSLLGVIEGSAVTSVIIKGVNNEFSTLPGIVEDIMQIVLNIKQIVIKNKENKPGTMKLVVSGNEKDVATVADIVCDEHLELINKDHVIATLAKDGVLDIEFFVESGRGYQLAQWPVGTSLTPDGRMYLDAMFSPVSNVVLFVEKTRVGKDIDYDKLTLEITTNGAETPVDVLNYAVSVLRTQLENFLVDKEIPFNDISSQSEEESFNPSEEVDDAGFKDIPVEALFKSIDELELSARAHNCLANANISRVIDLVNVSEDESLRIKNFGRKSLDEVKDVLRSLGLRFGMDIKEEVALKALKRKTGNK